LAFLPCVKCGGSNSNVQRNQLSGVFYGAHGQEHRKYGAIKRVAKRRVRGYFKEYSSDMKRNTILSLVIASFFVVLAPVPASAKVSPWVTFFFPSLKDDSDDPSKTLTAPFADKPAAAQLPAPPVTNVRLPENKIPLDTPHRNDKQMGDWVETAVSEALTFDKPNSQDSLNNNLKYFDEGGKQQYMAFLQDNSVLNVLQSGKFNIRGFAEEKPNLLNEGAVDGRYRWLFEVPIMVTYMDRNMKGYKDAQPVNQMMSVQVQVGRTADVTSGKDVVIEHWIGRVQDISKK
jgi:hypothetical protein